MRILFALFILSVAGVAPAQSQKPPITLTIAARESTVKSGQVDSLIVKEKNISKKLIDESRSMDMRTGYGVEILRNGNPVPRTKETLKREAASAAQYSCDPVCSYGWEGSVYFFILKPRQQTTVDFPIAACYDMSEPGVYQITLIDDMDRVKSNTITITVLPPDSSPARK